MEKSILAGKGAVKGMKSGGNTYAFKQVGSKKQQVKKPEGRGD